MTRRDRRVEREPRTSDWRDAQERWQAQLRLWAIEDQGGYLAAIERELAGTPPRYAIWATSMEKRAEL